MCCIICSVSDCILYLVAVIFPPVAVLLRSGFYSSDFLLNVLLTLLGFFPGLVHAFYYITITSPLRRDAEYVYFYQQGWADRERDAGTEDINRRGYGPHEDMRVPLLGPDGEANREPTMNEALLIQERQHRNSSSLKKGAPPPYTEMP
ncbi:hypothetical protein MOUN0_K06018 [Monosporozyma unispora]|nr:hypothetical protein C6P44_004464 [Kazachstania unispora]